MVGHENLFGRSRWSRKPLWPPCHAYPLGRVLPSHSFRRAPISNQPLPMRSGEQENLGNEVVWDMEAEFLHVADEIAACPEAELRFALVGQEVPLSPPSLRATRCCKKSCLNMLFATNPEEIGQLHKKLARLETSISSHRSTMVQEVSRACMFPRLNCLPCFSIVGLPYREGRCTPPPRRSRRSNRGPTTSIAAALPRTHRPPAPSRYRLQTRYLIRSRQCTAEGCHIQPASRCA